MTETYYTYHGRLDVYTMDHRGTGRSGRLTCTASQAEVSGSPGRDNIALDERPSCIQDIIHQVGGTLVMTQYYCDLILIIVIHVYVLQVSINFQRTP